MDRDRIPLTKLLDPIDWDNLDFKQSRVFLEIAEAKLKAQNILDPLPISQRYWEYAQGLRALSLAVTNVEEPEVLEIGGSTSLFMPTASLYLKQLKYDFSYTSLEHPGWLSKPNQDRQMRQFNEMGYPNVGRFTSTSNINDLHGDYDFIAVLSVIENMDYKFQEGDKANILRFQAHPGHLFMAEKVKEWAKLLTKNGILFLTSDCGERQPDTYMFNHMRPAGIWCPKTWWWLSEELTDDPSLELVGDADFMWVGNQVHNNYNFASMAIRKVK